MFKKKHTIIWQDGSQTIRLMPQNYLLAHKRDGRFVVEPDAAVPVKIATKVFVTVFASYKARWQTSGQVLADALNA